jgi:hypothetical protein
VLPIVFYDGKWAWTAERNFLHRTELYSAFEKYIPKFEYELVDLNKYSKEDLLAFADTLSLVMLVDKFGDAYNFKELGNLPKAYLEKIDGVIPDDLRKLLSDVIRTLLTKANLPKDEIESLSERIYERRLPEMFEPHVKYDIQETRRTARQEGIEVGEENIIRRLKKHGIAVETITAVMEDKDDDLMK